MLNPRVVVAGLIKHKNKYLLTKEQLTDNAYWIIPGGGVEFGESLHQAVLREIKEELGLDTKIVKFLTFKEAIFPDHNYHTIIFFYLLKPLTTNLSLESGILDVDYFTRSKIYNLKLVDSAKWLFDELSELD